MTSVGSVTLFRMVDYWDLVKGRAELHAKAEHALSQMRQDLAVVLPSSVSMVPLQGKSEIVPDTGRLMEAMWGQSLENDSIVIPCHMPTDEGRTLAGAVTYYVDRETYSLVREAREIGSDDPGLLREVADGVLKLRIEYGAPGEGGWQPEWTSDALPLAVRATLVMANRNRPTEQIVRQAVFPIYVE
jgi:hypothetical protein